MDHPSDSSSPSGAPDHLKTDIPSGELSQDHDHEATHSSNEKEKAPAQEEEGEDEDIDALIAELESEDGDLEDEEEAAPGMSARPIPEDLLQTDTRKGLTSQEVTERRKKYGMNQMNEEKENLFKKFLGYFVGPIQFVMEVCILRLFCLLIHVLML